MKPVAALFIAVLWVSVAQAQTDHSHGTTHDHNAQFQKADLDVEMWLGRLENPDRDVIVHRDAVIAALGLERGQHIADIGAGTGAYMTGIARIVGATGRYYGVDIAPALVGFMRDRAVKAGLENVTLVVSRIDHATLPVQSVDMILVVDTYHHFDPVKPMLASMFDALKPGGTLVIVDFDRIEGVSRDWVLERIRADKHTFRREIEAAGFRFVEEATDTGLAENFFFRFVRPE